MAYQLQPSLEQQIAGLAAQTPDSVAPDRYDYGNNSVLQKWVGQFEKITPPLTTVVEVVFRSVGVSEPYKVVGDYIKERQTAFMNDRSKSGDSAPREAIGNNIKPDAPLRQAFENLRIAFEQTHGSFFDKLLDQAEKFGFWLVEHSVTPE